MGFYKFEEVVNKWGKVLSIRTWLTGKLLLTTPELNKGMAFSDEERAEFDLYGKLPRGLEDLSDQVNRFYAQYCLLTNDLAKSDFLNSLRQHDQVAFYKLVSEHLIEMLPVIYTPTIGEAVKSHSYQFMAPRGLQLAYPDRNNLDEIFQNISYPEIDLFIMTDGERVLGIGDWGAGAVDICVGKLMVYTVCGGLNPRRMLPIQLDVGTDNETLLEDPIYIGWRHKRIRGAEYDAFVNQVIVAMRKRFPQVYLHWEDFAVGNARRQLQYYRQEMCTFNDDMQGTGAVTAACLLAAIKKTGTPLHEQRIVIFGAGTAGTGIADQLCAIMQRQGMSELEARRCFWLIDRQGLLFDAMECFEYQQPYLRSADDVKEWSLGDANRASLEEVILNLKPTVLIGCSAVKGAFTRTLVEAMSAAVERPIILPLSNPNSHAEAVPNDIYVWSQGRALIASGSPFDPVSYNGEAYSVTQCNNAFVFPGFGLGVIASKATRVTDAMLVEAVLALAECTHEMSENTHELLPPLERITEVSRRIALAVALSARSEGVAAIAADCDLAKRIEELFWQPEYVPLEKMQD